ncbi:MAG: radical SAM protein [Candidatus Methanofastidiosia archaeon]
MIIEEYTAKSVIRTSTPGLFSWSEYYLNPYQGCYHDCRYCDGKSEGYYMHADFAERIKVKVNAPALLEKFLRKKGFIPLNREKTLTLIDFAPGLKGTVKEKQPGKFVLFIGGGVCDVYQPAELDTKITRELLQIAYDFGFPVCILTKSNLVLRDLDLLKKINDETYACCNFTITLSDEMQKIFEPGASSTSERFNAVKTLRDNGIHSGVYFYPVLPFIGDTDDNMEDIYRRAQKVGAEFVYCWGLTLKPGRSKNEFLHTVKEHFPLVYPKYELLYSNNNKYGYMDVEQFKKLRLIFPEIKGFVLGYEHGLPYTADRYIPPGRITTNLKVAEVLKKIGYIKQYILQDSKVHSFYKAAKFLETYQKDISNAEGIEGVPILKNMSKYINEVIKGNESTYLKDLEKKAYYTASSGLANSRAKA